MSQVTTGIYGRLVTIQDAETLDELIRDCTDIPHAPRASSPAEQSRAAAPWQVNSACSDQVERMDDYGS
jgi:hypothetical protein